MSSYIRLDGHVVTEVPGGVKVSALTVQMPLDNEMTVEMPIPFVPIGGGLAITPALRRDGRRVSLDFTRWTPANLTDEQKALHPAEFHSQTEAVEAARAFDADPATSWLDSDAHMLAWSMAWRIKRGLSGR